MGVQEGGEIKLMFELLTFCGVFIVGFVIGAQVALYYVNRWVERNVK